MGWVDLTCDLIAVIGFLVGVSALDIECGCGTRPT